MLFHCLKLWVQGIVCNSERHPLTPAKKSPALLFLRSGAGDFLIICFVLLDSCQDQYRSQDNCTQQGEPDLVATEVPDAALRIFLRTDLQALLTLETVAAYIPAAVLRQGQIRRAYLFTGSTAFGAFFPFAPHREKRQNGQQGENSTHRTQETAKETLTEYHSHQDQHQQNAAQPICAHFEVSRSAAWRTHPRDSSP